MTSLYLFIGFKGTGSRTGTEGFTLEPCWSNMQRAAAPTFSLNGGNYASTQNVSLSCTTPNATIYYTTDGSFPSNLTGTAYTVPIEVSSATTITAIAYPPASVSMAASEAVAATYTVSASGSDPGTGSEIYRIIGEARDNRSKGSDGDLSFSVNCDSSKLQAVSVNGRPLERTDYASAGESTVITLTGSYIEKLGPGRYTLRVDFSDGYAKTEFTVGNGFAAVRIVAVIAVSIGLAVLFVCIKRKKHSA